MRGKTRSVPTWFSAHKICTFAIENLPVLIKTNCIDMGLESFKGMFDETETCVL